MANCLVSRGRHVRSGEQSWIEHFRRAFRALGRLVPLPTQFNFHLRSFDFPRAAKGWANLEEFRQFLIQRGWTEDWWTHRKPI